MKTMKLSKKITQRGFSILMVLLLSIAIVFSLAIPASAETANVAVTNVSKSLMQVRLVYTDDNGRVTPIQGGTCFLINENTVLTCSHVINMDSETLSIIKGVFGSSYKKDNLSLQVVVNGDVTITATVKKESIDADYAILNLTEAIYDRTSVILGDSDYIEATEMVFALGFPASVAEIQNRNTYTDSDVTITDGKVSKTTSTSSIDYLQHSAAITEGNSGGPLVDSDGVVYGINEGTRDGYSYAISINQIRQTLDALGIEYSPDPNPDITPTQAEMGDTTEAPTEAPTVAPATIPSDPADSQVDDSIDMVKLIVIIGICVLVVALVVIVIVVLLGNKKKSANKMTAQQKPIPSMPQPPMPQPSRPSAPQYPSQRPQQRPPMPMPMPQNNDGGDNTTVLNEGAGETTVLGQQSLGFELIRKSNGEKIVINKPEFVIGKERRRVDYCINDNNSISRAHAKIRVRAGKCYVSDLGSTNFTFLNGSKLSPNQEVALSSGDKIKISDEEFEFKA